MKKTKKELEELKEEVEALDEKLHELTDEELAQVTGGRASQYFPFGDTASSKAFDQVETR